MVMYRTGPYAVEGVALERAHFSSLASKKLHLASHAVEYFFRTFPSVLASGLLRPDFLRKSPVAPSPLLPAYMIFHHQEKSDATLLNSQLVSIAKLIPLLSVFF